MGDTLLRLYHQLPPAVRSIAATVRGAYLRHWRLGPGFERLVEETLDRDTWSADRLRRWEEERLAFVLTRAATRVPYYRDQWGARRRRGDRSALDQLGNWPVLEKDAVRANPLAFVAEDRHPRDLFLEHTSGTTGKPLDVMRSRETLTWLYAIAEARTLRWHGLRPGVRWARLGGQLVVPTSRTRPPFWVYNAAMRQLYLSSFHLAPRFIPHYLDALAKYKVRYIAAYTSSIAALAHEILRLGRTDVTLSAVFTNAEGLDDAQRAAISSAFHCPVRETYGQAEMVAAASECSAGALHRWPEAGIIETFVDGAPVPPEQTGEFICTGLLNADMPLIRYRIGDRGALSADAEPCACGRTLPRVAHIDGRTNDVLRTPDGRSIFWLNPIFYGLPVRESQIEQLDYEEVVVRVSPAPGFDAERDGARIRERLHARLGPARIALTLVESIPRTANGKLRAVICRVPAPLRDAAGVTAGAAS